MLKEAPDINLLSKLYEKIKNKYDTEKDEDDLVSMIRAGIWAHLTLIISETHDEIIMESLNDKERS